MKRPHLVRHLWTMGLAALLLGSCAKDDGCEDLLFGLPNIRTGLSADECVPFCGCRNFEARSFSPADLAALRQWEQVNAPEPLTFDPYNRPMPDVPDGVCGLVVENADSLQYYLETFANGEEALAAGATVTHNSPCGMCSSLQDLAVYAEQPDLGTLVRNCSFENLLAPFGQLVACLEDIGFSRPCAVIWAYNAKNTQEKCFQPCIEAMLSELLQGEIIPYNNADGSLSPCIGCDEEISGPIFKAYAGRTRRNSGLPAGICRSCDEVAALSHDYPIY